MASNVSQRPTTHVNGPPEQSPAESIDQVRDLLFGGQMRMVDTRIQSLDERLLQEAASIRAEIERRVEELRSLNAELKDSLKSLERRHLGLEEAAGRADAELRDHVVKQGAALSSDLEKSSERITSHLDRIAAQLKSEKLDSAALSSALIELAGKLGPRE